MPARRKTDIARDSRSCKSIRRYRLKLKAKEENEIRSLGLSNPTCEETSTQFENNVVVIEINGNQHIFDNIQPEVWNPNQEFMSARKARLLVEKSRKQKLRASETSEQRDKRLTVERKRVALRRVTKETPDQREKRLTVEKERVALCRATKETPEQRDKRLAADRIRHALRRAANRKREEQRVQHQTLETPEEEEIRLERKQLPHAQHQALDNTEQPETHLQIKLPQVVQQKSFHNVHSEGSTSFDKKPMLLREARLLAHREYQRKLRASETHEQRENRLAADRIRHALRRKYEKYSERKQIRAARIQRQCLPALSNTVWAESSVNKEEVDSLFEIRSAEKPKILAVLKTTTVSTSTMETEEFTIKNEIDIEEEKLIRVNTELVKVPLKTEILQPEDDPNTPADPVILNLYDNIQIEIKQETDSDHKESNYLVERNDKTAKPTVIREAETFNTQAHIDARIKKEQDESIVSYDFPNFDDADSVDSNEAEALRNVETSLQDYVGVKTENGGHQNTHDDFHNNEVKIESEIVPEPNTSNHIIPDMPETGPKYSFIVKIPATIRPDDETINDFDVKMNNTSSNLTTEQTSLLEETDQSEAYDLNPFQLNSITGNVLSLEQEAFIMLQPKKKIPCPKCPNAYKSKSSLHPHLKVHQTIENYENGRKRGRETAKKNRMKRIQLLKQQIDEHDSQDSCSHQQEVKVENKEGYKCTCGKSFQRKTRMESCLRSHDYSESEKYYCMTCLKDFKSKDDLALHRKRLHRKKFPCKFCPTDYATRKKLFKHLQIHQKVNQMEYIVIEEVVKSKKKLRCFFCSKCCEDISELKIHVMSEHKGPYSCPHCRNTFPKLIDFGNHTKTYHPEVGGQSVLDALEAFLRLTEEWKCEECDLRFLEADKLALHQVEQHNPELKCDNQFQCPDCRRVFISQKGLTSHRRIHHSTETTEQAKDEVTGIMCLECRKMCKDISALTSHMRFHSPDRKYPCKFCDFRFATPEKRKTHAEIHTGDMKYVCFICEYQCSSENRLKKHKHSLKHANMKEYLLTGKPLLEESSTKDKDKKDGSAKKRKKSKEDGKSDNDTSSNKDVSCDVCGEKFSSESQMLEHKETHPFIEIPSADKPTRIFFK